MDSHAHCNNTACKDPFRYLTCGADGYALREGGWPRLLQESPEAEQATTDNVIRLFNLPIKGTIM